jgi:glycine betaine transporter
MSDLDANTRLKIDSMVEEYELKLRQELHAIEDRHEIDHKKKNFREQMIENELKDLETDEQSLDQEEKSLINSNLILSLSITTIMIILAMVFSSQVTEIAESLTKVVTEYFNWFYVLLSTCFIIFLAYLSFTKYGDIVLGDPEQPPEFSLFSWLSMLFSAGMGLGILFWGAAEPLTHYMKPPFGEPESVHSAKLAMAYTAFHWGLHGWAPYTVCALGVAYYGFRKRKKYLVSSSIMDITHGPKRRKALKVFADLVSTLAITFGVAASLGMGLVNIASGFKSTLNWDLSGFWGQFGIMAIVAVSYIISSATGLKRGIKYLSNLNMILSIVLMAFVFLAGPKLFIIKVFVDSIGQYLQYLPSLSFEVSPYREGYQRWMGGWTVSYFAWWIAWSPFVGIFIARVSQGRTLRQMIMGALLIPTIFSILWFAIFGGAAIHMQMFEGIPIAEQVLKDPSVGVYALLQQFSLGKVFSVVAIVLVCTYLITSADSATFVIGMMTSEGDMEPKISLRIIWGLVLAALAFLLAVGGGIRALMATSLTFAFPFALVLILVAVSVTIRLSIQLRKNRL